VVEVQRGIELTHDPLLDGAHRVAILGRGDHNTEVRSDVLRHDRVARGLERVLASHLEHERIPEKSRHRLAERGTGDVAPQVLARMRLARVAEERLPDGHFVAPACPQ